MGTPDPPPPPHPQSPETENASIEQDVVLEQEAGNSQVEKLQVPDGKVHEPEAGNALIEEMPAPKENFDQDSLDEEEYEYRYGVKKYKNTLGVLPPAGVVQQLISCSFCKVIIKPPLYICAKGLHQLCSGCIRRMQSLEWKGCVDGPGGIRCQAKGFYKTSFSLYKLIYEGGEYGCPFEDCSVEMLGVENMKKHIKICDKRNVWKCLIVDCTKRQESFKERYLDHLLTYHGIPQIKVATDGWNKVHWPLINKWRTKTEDGIVFILAVLKFDDDTRLLLKASIIENHVSIFLSRWKKSESYEESGFYYLIIQTQDEEGKALGKGIIADYRDEVAGGAIKILERECAENYVMLIEETDDFYLNFLAYIKKGHEEKEANLANQ